MRDDLLIEIGCEEIPARMIRRAGEELERRLLEILDEAGLERGDAEHWGGSRRLAVRVADVAGRQQDRQETVTGPPASVAFDADGAPTGAARGFAKKQGVEPEALERITTERGEYVGFTRDVEGLTLEALLDERLGESVAAMGFAKSMRWGDGTHRWVRPVHWCVALHGAAALDVGLFGIRSGRRSRGHRFLGEREVTIPDAASYEASLAAQSVVVDPGKRRERVAAALSSAAAELGGEPVADEALLDEVADLVELPGVVLGRFDESYLTLPRELLVTTLRHHQKCFSIQDDAETLLPGFLAIANTDRDPGGHVRRGNEWVVGGRLEDARFFWREDRKQPLAERLDALERIVVHRKIGHYRDRAERTARLAGLLAGKLGLDEPSVERAERAARLAKVDLVTGTVGEFPELQGKVGGLLLEADGEAPELARAVYEHYRPAGPDDDLPTSDLATAVALADKLDQIGQFIAKVERPTGSRDPFGLRRAVNGLFRILLERDVALSFGELREMLDHDESFAFLVERLPFFLRERGASSGEVQAVVGEGTALDDRSPADLARRLDALRAVRTRDDFKHLVHLTKRVDNILVKNVGKLPELEKSAAGQSFAEDSAAAIALGTHIDAREPQMRDGAAAGAYPEVIEHLASFIAPVDGFFEEVLVIDPERAEATLARVRLLTRLREVLTADFDIRALAGDAKGGN